MSYLWKISRLTLDKDKHQISTISWLKQSNTPLKKLPIKLMLIAIFYKDIYRLGARDGFIQPIIIERFDLQFIN